VIRAAARTKMLRQLKLKQPAVAISVEAGTLPGFVTL